MGIDTDSPKDGNMNDDDLFDPIIARIKDLESQVAKLKAECADAEETANYYKKTAENCKNKIQAREVLEAVLPYISDLLNDLGAERDIADFRVISDLRFEELVRDLGNIGITVKAHREGEEVDPSYICNLRSVPTDDASKNGKVAKCTLMGCEFGDGTDPILEGLDVYSSGGDENQEDK